MSQRHSPRWSNRREKPPYGTVGIDWAHPLARNLGFDWEMNEGAGGKVNDLTGFQRHGTIAVPGTTGVLWSPSGVVSAGSSSSIYITVPTIAMTKDCSLEFWLKPSALTDSYQCVFTKNGVEGVYLRSTGKIDYYSAADYQSTLTLSVGAWAHVVVSLKPYDASFGALWIYINGVPENINHQVSACTASACLNDTSNETFLGEVGRIRGWIGRALGDDEVTQLYADPFCFLKEVTPRSYGFMSEAAGGGGVAYPYSGVTAITVTVPGAYSADLAATAYPYAGTTAITILVPGAYNYGPVGASYAGTTAITVTIPSLYSFLSGAFLVYCMGLLEPLPVTTPAGNTYAGTTAVTVGVAGTYAFNATGGLLGCDVAGLTPLWNDDFADGDPLSTHYTSIIDAETNATCGVSSGWGCRTTGTAQEQYYGGFSLVLGSAETGKDWALEITTDLAAYADNPDGSSLLELRDGTWFFSLYGGLAADGADLAVWYWEQGTGWVSSTANDVVTPETFQTIRVIGRFSTWSGDVQNADGAITVCVDGTPVIELIGIRFNSHDGLNNNGADSWNEVYYGPMGNADNVKAWGT